MTISIYITFIVLYFFHNNLLNIFHYIFLFNLSNFSNINNFILSIYWFLYNYDFNLYIYQINTTNKNLYNILLLYHPTLLYLFIVNYFVFFKYYLLNNDHQYYFNFYNYSLALLISFVFSSYWSVHEILWYGFWNWDLIEISFLVVLIVEIFFKHTFSKFYYFFRIKLTIIFLILIVNKTNLINTQHSFSDSFFSNLEYLYSFSCFLIIIVYLYKNTFIFAIKNFFINMYILILVYYIILNLNLIFVCNQCKNIIIFYFYLYIKPATNIFYFKFMPLLLFNNLILVIIGYLYKLFKTFKNLPKKYFFGKSVLFHFFYLVLLLYIFIFSISTTFNIYTTNILKLEKKLFFSANTIASINNFNLEKNSVFNFFNIYMSKTLIYVLGNSINYCFNFGFKIFYFYLILFIL